MSYTSRHPTRLSASGSPVASWAVLGILGLVLILGPGVHQASADGPLVIEAVGQWGGPAHAVAVEGSLAYVTFSARLLVFDVSDPDHPALLGRSVVFPAGVGGIALAGGYAYLAGTAAGLHVVDVHDPAHPVRVGGCDTPGAAYAVAVAGSHAFVADASAGLQVIDITDPAAPVIVGAYDTIGISYGVAVWGSHAYLADNEEGLQVIDFSNPASPVRVGGYNTSGQALGVSYSGSHAYVADGNGGLQVFNVSNPAQPVRVGTDGLVSFARQVFLAGSHALVSGTNNGRLTVVDITNPAMRRLVGSHNTGGSVHASAASGTHAFIADALGLVVVDISSPEAPAAAGMFRTIRQAVDLYLSGPHAFVADVFEGLHIVNVADPVDPFPVGFLPLDDALTGVAAVGDYAFLATSAGIQVVDVSAPASPVLVSECGACAYAYDLTIAGSYAYVADGEGLLILDITNPVSPVRVGSYFVGSSTDVTVIGSRAFLAGSGFHMFDVADPTNILPLGSRIPEDSASDVTLVGTHACLASRGITVIDISNPLFHTLAGRYDTPGYSLGIEAAGTYVYVVSSLTGGSLDAFDLSTPARPVRLGGEATGAGSDIVLRGNHAFVAQSGGGIRVFSLGVGACCVNGSCVDHVAPGPCEQYICDAAGYVSTSLPVCFGDVDANGTVNAGDRGMLAGSIGQTDRVPVCRYDLDGNGVINAGDRGIVSANIGHCAELPDYMNGSGLNRGLPDTRFSSASFLGVGTTCADVTCP
jgi:hypothetical protein